MRRFACVVLPIVIELASSSDAMASKNPIDLDTATSPPPPRAAAAPSPTAAPTAAAADRLFDAGRWPEAALALDAVRRDANASQADAQRAQFRLAIALHHLGLLQTSYAIFSEIAERPNHVAFDATLPWLAKLAAELPEPADVIERVGKYTQPQIARLAAPTDRELRAQLSYMLGRYKYRNRQYDQALALFASVDRDSKSWAPSQLYAGITNVLLRRAEPAGGAFKSVLEADLPPADASHMRDLARMSLARLGYSESIRIDEHGQANIDARALGGAIRQWSAIDASSEYWLDAVFEQSWAYFMAGDYSRALGNIHTLQAPYFPDAYYPEADVLRSVIYFTECQYDDAALIATGMQRKYEPIYAELSKVLSRYSGDDRQDAFYRFLKQVRRDQERGTHDAALSREIEPLVRRAFSDRQIVRNLEYVGLLEDEAARFARMDLAFRSSPLGSDVKDSLELAHDIAVRNAGTLAAERYQRSLDELGDHMRSGAHILVEIARQMSPDASTAAFAQRGGDRNKNVVRADNEHILWPFRDEYWRDELGTYRQSIVSKCSR